MDEAAQYMSGLYGSLGLGFPSRFEQSYRCYSASFIDKAHLELGDKVIMPPSALDRLASLRIDYPMLFEMHNPAISRTTHCGVLEFVAEEGMIYMPYWMMQNLLLQEGEIVRVKSAALPKGTYVKLQPHTKDFLDISNPKAVLETALRNFSCLTVGDNIMVAYNNKKYYIDIVEAKPAMAISIIETDCEVDFAPPLDYKEPERVLPQVPVSLPAVEGAHAVEQKEVVSFSAFTGSGRRLDGKPARQSSKQENILQEASVSSAAPNLSSSTTSAVTSAPQKRSGKLVFGASPSNVSAKPIGKEVAAKDEVKEKEPPKFQAFTGKKYSLKD